MIDGACDGNCAECDLIKSGNLKVFLKVLEEFKLRDVVEVSAAFCPEIEKLLKDYLVNNVFPGGILFERVNNQCDRACDSCAFITSRNRRVPTSILNALAEVWADDVVKVTNGYCPSLTVCPDCHVDDLCHVDGACVVCSAVDKYISLDD